MATGPDLVHDLETSLDGEVRFDAYSRHLYATDASMYAIEPLGVVFPRHRDDIVATVQVAAAHGVPVLPRGAGTSHCGQTVGAAVVMDCSRHLNAIVAVDPEAKTARVQPGVVQDSLNRAAGQHGLMFAPDTSTANRATLGGMIGNNSCGARSARYGMTIDHVRGLDVVLSDGSTARFEAVDTATRRTSSHGDTLAARLHREIPRLVERNRQAIVDGTPPFWRRSGGYRLERLLDGPLDLSALVVGSEGTLAVVTEATVGLVDKPAATVACVGHFTSVTAAIDATMDAVECGAAGIELVDRFILDLARRSPEHAHLASGLDGDPEALLFAEFHGASQAAALAGADRLEQAWRRHGHGYTIRRAVTASEQGYLRAMRRAGLGLLMAAGHGQERSLAFIEDTAVDPTVLADYTKDLAAILDKHGLRAGFYGHASAGCLHVRPFMDLARDGEPARMRAVAGEVAALVAGYGGVNSSEHGDGLARSEFNRELFGEPLYEAMREVKRLFDPDGRLNPGKVVDAPPMTEHLREPALPPARLLPTHFEFDGGLRDAANRCMRIGACRKDAAAGGTMCPSYLATLDEQHSTRGRANALVKALSEPDPRAAMGDERLHEILDLCLECKACQRECPLSIDMATMKSEVLAQRHAQHGVPLRSRLFGRIRSLNRAGAALAPLSNTVARFGPARWVLERAAGIDRRRPLPAFARQSLSRWFARRPTPQGPFPRGELAFLADSFTSYTEPGIGRAAIELLERSGWQVRLITDVCCGRAQISKGLLDEAARTASALVDRLAPLVARGVPVTGCEPSCLLTLVDEHPRLVRDGRAKLVAGATRLVEELLLEALDAGELSIDDAAAAPADPILFHGHCHQKAVTGTKATVELLRRLPHAEVIELDAGCCGLAGSFGYEREHYDLSMKIGNMRLFPAVARSSGDTLIAATGTSCRQQIAHGAGRQARHPVELLHAAVGEPPS
jgi:FAD/FMN-containing dehydrogenase/Fe-S oxidoreductase